MSIQRVIPIKDLYLDLGCQVQLKVHMGVVLTTGALPKRGYLLARYHTWRKCAAAAMT